MDIERPPMPVYALFSGGKDSYAVACALEEAGLLKGVVLIDTGVAADTWLSDVMAIVTSRGWTYEIQPTTTRYEWFVNQYGFPGPGMHGMVMTYLKGRAIRQWKKRHPGEALASGVRSDESTRRGWSTTFQSQWEGVTVYAPILNWTTAETWAYVRSRGYQQPRTYLTLGVSGDCLCGAFAMPHEPEAIREHCPKLAQRIESMTQHGSYGWGQRAIEKHDATMALPYVEGLAVACSDCWRGIKP
jgi:3'-phosphoadenosine 5'-phosphosulfate sulfotransferase (PAPS reductase)/FAD synthetase